MSKSINPKYYDIIRSPIITEKSSIISEQSNKVFFNVYKEANKTEIKEAVEAIFGVKVSKVNVILQKGKKKRFKGVLGKRNDVKKAIVTLEGNKRIDITSGV